MEVRMALMICIVWFILFTIITMNDEIVRTRWGWMKWSWFRSSDYKIAQQAIFSSVGPVSRPIEGKTDPLTRPTHIWLTDHRTTDPTDHRETKSNRVYDWPEKPTFKWTDRPTNWLDTYSEYMHTYCFTLCDIFNFYIYHMGKHWNN